MTLTTDETFLEDVKIGLYLPNGKKCFLEWQQQRATEVKHAMARGKFEEKEDDASDSNVDEIDLFARLSKNVQQGNKEIPVASDARSMLTAETLSTKWLADDDDDNSEGKKELSPFDSKDSATTPISIIRKNPETGNSGRRGSRKRKTPIFDQGGGIQRSDASVKDGILVGQSIETNSSSVYSMLREWVQKDGRVGVTSVRRRNVLMDYASMKPNTIDDNRNGETGETDVSNSESLAQTTGATTTSTPPAVNLFYWLKTPPSKRAYYPFYPTNEEVRERQKAKAAAKVARKKRVATIKANLKRKGIFL